MGKANITSATTTQVSGPVHRVLVQVNAALTGTITLYDATTGTTGVSAVITNPGVGSVFEYWDFAVGVRVVTSATCDITVSFSDR
jgi:hypothetical protein